MQKLSTSYRRPADLKPNPKNVRVHSAKQIEQLSRSIDRFGFNSPILIDSDDMVICGHGRLEAAKRLQLVAIPTIRIEHLTEAQKRAFVIADNRLAELSSWDDHALAVELEQLQMLEDNYEIVDTGFEIGDIDARISALHEHPDDDPADRPTGLSKVRQVARSGDLWSLGHHRLFCGDALDPGSFEVLLGSERAEMIFTDPPYNVPINGHVSGRGKACHGEFLMASGEMSSREFADFLKMSFQQMTAASVDGSIHYICMDGPHLPELLEAAASIYSELKNVCVWDKGRGGMGSLYRSQNEFVAVMKHGTAPHINNVQLSRFGRNRTTVWRYPGLNSFQKGRAKTLAMHPTVKPVALVADAILDCSNPKGIILDPFGGSGTALIAAERTGRRAYVMELDPHYVDVALHRFHDVTGIEPVNIWTGARLTTAPFVASATDGR